MLNLKNLRFPACTAFFLLFMINFIQPATAQFIDLRLKIDSKLSAETEQSLSFKVGVINSGKKTIHPGDVNMGILSLHALENQALLISVHKPEALFHQNPAIVDQMPIDLRVRFGYSTQNYNDSFLLKSSLRPVTVKEDTSEGPWNTIYIFMYGSVTVGDVAAGLYTNDLILQVEYM